MAPPFRSRLLPGLVAVLAFALAVPVSGDSQPKPPKRTPLANLVRMEQVVAWVEDRYEGRLLEVELEMESYGDEDIPTYEVEWLTPAGNVIEFEFDARNGALLEIEGRGAEEARRK